MAADIPATPIDAWAEPVGAHAGPMGALAGFDSDAPAAAISVGINERLKEPMFRQSYARGR